MPWDTILQFTIAALLAIVSAVGARMNSHLANVHTKEDAAKALETQLKMLKCLRRQLYFEQYQRKVNRIITTKLDVSASEIVDLEAPSDAQLGDEL